MKVKLLLSLLTALAIAAAFAPSAKCQNLQFDLNVPPATPGSTVDVFGYLYNSSSTDTIELDSLSVDFGNTPYITDDTSPFDLNAPQYLAPGASYSGDLVNISVDPSTPAGPYYAFVDFSDQDQTTSNFEDSTGAIELDVAPAPESSGVVGLGIMLALGACGLGLTLSRRRTAA